MAPNDILPTGSSVSKDYQGLEEYASGNAEKTLLMEIIPNGLVCQRNIDIRF